MSMPAASPAVPPQGSNRRILAILAIVVLMMVGLAYASVPLYQLFCQVTGYGGTTQVTDTAADAVVPNHPIKVRFDANTNPALNWRFEAVDAPLTLNPGEEVVINYRATNLGDTASTGTSTYNVTPVKAGPHFMKIDCFCFIEQTLQPGESVLMPVRFYIDPEIVADSNTVDVDEIILSYTFFAVQNTATTGDT
ncbi:MAG: cytochrome c oxidase assembly protein [Pseudomonadota bacterium]|jgi:cytochrome c oxidase assembly protein subunit 11|nr:cytochrome c oxidase assembly protein [Pseudomonadota bacterium]